MADWFMWSVFFSAILATISVVVLYLSLQQNRKILEQNKEQIELNKKAIGINEANLEHNKKLLKRMELDNRPHFGEEDCSAEIIGSDEHLFATFRFVNSGGQPAFVHYIAIQLAYDGEVFFIDLEPNVIAEPGSIMVIEVNPRDHEQMNDETTTESPIEIIAKLNYFNGKTVKKNAAEFRDIMQMKIIFAVINKKVIMRPPPGKYIE